MSTPIMKYLMMMLLAFSMVLMAQDTPPDEVEETPPAAEVEAPIPIDQAIESYRLGEFEQVINLLEAGVAAKDLAATILSADAHFGLQEASHLKSAISLYMTAIYDLEQNPYADHCYFRLGEAHRTLDQWDDANLYYGQYLKKFPQGEDRLEATFQRFQYAVHTDNNRKMMEYAKKTMVLDTAGRYSDRVEPLAFIYADPPPDQPAVILSKYEQHKDVIQSIPSVLVRYADRLFELDQMEQARRLYVDLTNLHPHWDRNQFAILRMGMVEERLGHIEAADFLYQRTIRANPEREEAGYAWLRVAQLLERGKLAAFTIDGVDYPYHEVLDRIIESKIPDEDIMPFYYRQALLYGLFGNERAALDRLEELNAAYDKGPYKGLYRGMYHTLLHSVIARHYAQKQFDELDGIYKKHRDYLDRTTQTDVARLIIDSYLQRKKIDQALDLYERTWNQKLATQGFELAYEEIMTEALELNNLVRRDRNLSHKITEYENIYGDQGRFKDRLDWVKVNHQSRILEAEPFLALMKERNPRVENAMQARTLALIGLVARENKDYVFLDQLYAKVKAWKGLEHEMPYLSQQIRLYEADRLMSTGRYHLARGHFQAIFDDPEMNRADRNWAALQIARLIELQGDRKRALRAYGQAIYASDDPDDPIPLFAGRRMNALAVAAQIEEEHGDLRLAQD